jgi:hypothetical protein
LVREYFSFARLGNLRQFLIPDCLSQRWIRKLFKNYHFLLRNSSSWIFSNTLLLNAQVWIIEKSSTCSPISHVVRHRLLWNVNGVV